VGYFELEEFGLSSDPNLNFMLNILLPLDGSELAEGAIAHARAIGSALAAQVTLLRVIVPEEFRTEDAFSRVDWRLRRQQAHAYLQGVAETFAAADIPCQLRIEEGCPADVIMAAARDLDSNLLIMSTHGCGAAMDFPKGGVASKVLSMFDASICLVGARSVPAREPKPLYQHLLVPIDGSHESECALRVGISLAKASKARLSVIYINEVPAVPSILGDNAKARKLCLELAEMARRAAEQKLLALKARIPEMLELRTSVILTDRSTAPIEEIAHQFNPDLLITSTTMTSHTGKRSATTTQIASAVDHIPVLMLGPRGIGDAFREFAHDEPPDIRSADVS
jgi:nucleotide-binding universal stress UspA family protein